METLALAPLDLLEVEVQVLEVRPELFLVALLLVASENTTHLLIPTSQTAVRAALVLVAQGLAEDTAQEVVEVLTGYRQALALALPAASAALVGLCYLTLY